MLCCLIIYLFTAEHSHIKRTVAESSRQNLLLSFKGNYIIAPMIGGSVADLNGCSLLDPFFSRILGNKVWSVIIGQRIGQLVVRDCDLSQDEGNYISRFPETNNVS